ncbi:hypothetical protein KAR91_18570, partial [Candidatus Pacearchaeota archaeon]|nr:hypothetical protein [Candidatus Pacearchaeota archaeon]
MRNWKAWLAVAGTLGVTAVALLNGGEFGTPDPERMMLLNKTVSEQHLIQSVEIIAAKPGDEIVSKRTANSKHFKVTNNTFAAKIEMHAVHYLDPEDGVYKDPDLTIKDVSAEAKADPKRTFDKYVNPGNGLPKTTWMEGFKENYTFFHPDGDSVKYRVMFDLQEIEVALAYEMETTKEFITLDDAGDGNTLSWIIETSAGTVLRGQEIYYTDDKGKFLFRNPVPWAKDAAGKYIDIDVTFNLGLLTYVLDIPGDVVYPIIVDPSTTVQAVLDGHMRTQSGRYTSGSSNEGSRDTTEATDFGAGGDVGQTLAGAIYWNMRMSLLFPLPATLNIATVTAGSLYAKVESDNSTTDFDVVGVTPTVGGAVTAARFNDFDGWEATGVYSTGGKILFDVVNTSTMSAGSYTALPFSAAGLDSVADALADTFRVLLLSAKDINN